MLWLRSRKKEDNQYCYKTPPKIRRCFSVKNVYFTISLYSIHRGEIKVGLRTCGKWWSIRTKLKMLGKKEGQI